MKQILVPALIALAVLTGGSAVSAAPASPALIQTVDGVTVQITGVSWHDYTDLAKPSNPNLDYRGRKALVVSFDVKVANPPVLRPGQPSNDVLAVWLVDSDGSRIPGSYVAGQPNERTFIDSPEVEYWVDPRQPVRIECIYRRSADLPMTMPQVPALEFKGISIPQDVGKPIPIGVTQTAPNGVRITLDSVGIQASPSSAAGNTCYVTGHWTPPEDNPGICPSITLSRRSMGTFVNGLEDDAGNPLQDRRHHPQVSPGNAFDPKDHNLGHFSIVGTVPAPGSKSLTLRFDVGAGMHSTVEPAQFHFDIPRESITMPPVKPAADQLTPLATMPLGNDTLTLENLDPAPWGGWNYRWRGRMFLESHPAPGDHSEWISTSARYSNGAGTPMVTSTGMAGRYEFYFWKRDDTLIGDRDRYFSPTVQFDNKLPAAPTSTDYETDWIQVERIPLKLELKNLSVPPAGSIVGRSDRVEAGKLGSFVVRQIGAFDSEHPLSPTLTAATTDLQPSNGLVVVVDYVPAAGIKPPAWNAVTDEPEWSFGEFRVTDDTGRDLMQRCYDPYNFGTWQRPPSTFQLKDLLTGETGPKVYRMSFLVLPPAAKAKSFGVTFTATHTQTLKTETVIFKNIPLSPMGSAAAATAPV